MTKRKFPIYVICDNIRSLYNVGAIFRTSDATNISKIYLCEMTGYPKNDPNWHQTKKIEKTALGSTSTVKWKYIKNSLRLINRLKFKGIKIYALEIDNRAINYNEIKYDFPCAFVLGHEINGINPKILNIADKIIKIPMRGLKTSLNVEAAFAVSIYEILKYAK